jgi:hypothetical protein
MEASCEAVSNGEILEPHLPQREPKGRTLGATVQLDLLVHERLPGGQSSEAHV